MEPVWLKILSQTQNINGILNWVIPENICRFTMEGIQIFASHSL